MTEFFKQYGKHPEVKGFNIPKEKITVKIDGQEVNLWDRIQAANVDCDIYETLEKYNMAPTLANCENILEKRPLLYQDLSKIQQFEHPQDAVDYANDLWKQMPLDVRKKFNHDIHEFMRSGNEWAEKKAKPYMEKYLAKLKEQKQSKQSEKSEVNNNAEK